MRGRPQQRPEVYPSRPLTALGILLTCCLLPATPAWAVQAHGGAEGLVAHQIGHVLFTIGIGYLLSRPGARQNTGRGWFEFKACLWLLIAWNLVTFAGHWMNQYVAEDQFVKAGPAIIAFSIETVPDALYYLTNLDHLLLVPAILCLLLALRRWRLQR